MKNKNLLLSMALLLCLPAISQNLEWAKHWGNESYDLLSGIKTDHSGNVYAFGYFYGTEDFDPGVGVYQMTSTGGVDAFILKLDPSGDILWARQMGGHGNIWINDLIFDDQDNIFVTGAFNDTIDIDPGPGVTTIFSPGNDNILIVKIDPSGNMIWGYPLGGTSTDSGSSIVFDQGGNLLISGAFRSTVDFNNGSGTAYLTSQGYTDGFVLKLKPNGDFIWVRRFGGTGDEGCARVKTDVYSNVYMLMYLSGTVDFNPGAGTCNISSQGDNDLVLTKLDSLGIFRWAFSLGSTGDEYGSFLLDSLCNIYMVGTFEETVDFDPEPSVQSLTSSLYGPDVFVSKMDSSLNLIWLKQIGNFQDEIICNQFVMNNNNHLIFAANFADVLDLDPGTGTFMISQHGIYLNGFVEELDNNGNFVGGSQIIYSGSGGGHQLACGDQGEIYTAGAFNDSVYYYPPSQAEFFHSDGSADIFLFKLSYTVGLSGETAMLPSLYPNPAGDQITITGFQPAEKNIDVKIYNSQGRLMYSVRVKDSENSVTVNTSAFPPGLYLVSLNHYCGKFIRQ